ncbi:hypothetical protein PENANT_c003G07511 [Penicillium antarcticum]|uniref:Apple domain-containing protein n=1 Tax=Penicillium antarcticum TaxID=416450 RepID=A0A1V6QHL6_9EURO|nr:uncharacterized protein N7508_005897 [Penicillium antarcticum]KAJ5306882.1 hypothetical protein N7508_005897 [Penicillium antarcticum]OQD88724.1 hypothetical protein PENANT_c003G07511 [Penicillium antarcticum]
MKFTNAILLFGATALTKQSSAANTDTCSQQLHKYQAADLNASCASNSGSGPFDYGLSSKAVTVYCGKWYRKDGFRVLEKSTFSDCVDECISNTRCNSVIYAREGQRPLGDRGNCVLNAFGLPDSPPNRSGAAWNAAYIK